MAATVAIGIQNFDKLREGEFCYIDKTSVVYDMGALVAKGIDFL